MNDFKKLIRPKSYNLDKINLDIKFKKLQMSFHPDRQVQIEQVQFLIFFLIYKQRAEFIKI